jgi:hypothetical protein
MGARRPQLTIASAMALSAAASALLVSPTHDHKNLFCIALFVAEFILPCRLLFRFGRPHSAAEAVSATLAMAYLSWGALFLFRPGYPPLFSDPYPEISRWTWEPLGILFHPGNRTRYPEVWAQVRRWNWGLLTAFYAALLAGALAPRVWRRLRRKAVGSSPKARPRSMRPETRPQRLAPFAEFGAMLWLLTFWSGWLSAVGLAALMFVVVAPRLRRPGPRGFARHAARAARLAPAVAAGVLLALIWTWSGWRYTVGPAALLIAADAARTPWSSAGGRLLAWARFLALFWAFAVAVQLSEPPTPPHPYVTSAPPFAGRP